MVSDLGSMIANQVIHSVSKDHFRFSISASNRLAFEESPRLLLAIVISMRASPQGCINMVQWSNYKLQLS